MYNPTKRIFTLVLVVFLASSILPLKAQLLIGPKIGGKLSWIPFNEPNKEFYKVKPVIGFSGGVTASYRVQKRFSLQADIMYSHDGKKVVGLKDVALENRAAYHYFNFPIIYRLDFKGAIQKAEFKWFLGAGPNVRFWWKGNGTLKSSELLENNIDQLDYKVKFGEPSATPDDHKLYVTNANRLQLGLLLASGIILEPAPERTILIELRMEWGHTFLADDVAQFPNILAYRDDLRARNHSIQLSVSYLIDTMISQRKKKKNSFK